jgi:hypothetical protein
MKTSELDAAKQACLRYGWPLEFAEGEDGTTCACGAWVPRPDEAEAESGEGDADD